MNRELISHSNFLNEEIRELRAHIQKINKHLKLGNELSRVYNFSNLSPNIIKEHKKKYKEFRASRNMYQKRLNDYLNMKRRLNRIINEMKPSTSGRKKNNK